MSGKFQPPARLDFNNPASWLEWKDQFLTFRIASKLRKDEGIEQVHSLLYAMGPEATKIFRNFVFPAHIVGTDPDPKENFDTVLGLFDTYFVPKQNILHERAKFYVRKQLPVVLDNTGTSKGFGFVRFSEELDQHRALMEMQHMTGIGQRQIKVGLAGPKRGWAMSTTVYKNQSEDYGGSYSQAPYPGSSGYYTWGGYYPYGPHHASHQPPAHKYLGETQAATSEDLEVLEDPCLEINVTKENREFMESSETFFEALDRSRWFAIDGVQSEIPA